MSSSGIRSNPILNVGAITLATAGGTVAGIGGGVVTYFSTVITGVGIQAMAGGSTLAGPATIGGTIVYNVVGILLPPIAIIGSVSAAIITGCAAGQSIYNALSG